MASDKEPCNAVPLGKAEPELDRHRLGLMEKAARLNFDAFELSELERLYMRKKRGSAVQASPSGAKVRP